MSIDQGTEQITIQKRDRTWRVEFFIADDDSQQMRFHREIQAKNTTTGAITKDRDAIVPVQRTGDQIKAKSYTAGGITATGQQIIQLINRMSDVERQYDIDNPPTPPV